MTTTIRPSDATAVAIQTKPSYKASVNLTQGIIAGIEAKVLTGQKTDHSLLIGTMVLFSSVVPPSGVFGIWGPNEKLWETLIATFIGGAILKAFAGGNYLNKAAIMLLIDTSSMAITDEIYTGIILGGINSNASAYRALYPEANYMNRAFLG